MPLNVNLLASSIVSVSVTVQYGTQSAQTFVSLPVIQPEVSNVVSLKLFIHFYHVIRNLFYFQIDNLLVICEPFHSK